MQLNATAVARMLSTVEDVVVAPSRVAGSQTAHPNDAGTAASWSLLQRVAFRWAAIYIVLYCLPFPAGAVYGLDWAEDLWLDLWHAAIVPWMGANVLKLEQPVAFVPTGSSDTLYHWVQLFTHFTLAMLGAVVWSIVDRRRTQYRRAFAWLYLYVRYDLAWEMLRYGIHKVFALQFVTGPTLSRMLETYGESSPFGLSSTFMGSSTTYLVFAGAAETVGGALLLFRRTTPLGALVVVPVMANVVLMNFCYDLPVKIHSSHILFLTMFLLAPEARRLVRVIVLGQPVEGVENPAPARGWARRARAAFKIAVVAALVVPQLFFNRAVAANLAERHPLFGVYEAVPDGVPGDVRTVVVDEVRVLAIRRESGPMQRFQIARNSEPGTLALGPYRRAGQKAKLRYRTAEDGALVLSGVVDDAPFDLRLRKLPLPSFLLQTRGFHWVSDNAFDR